MKTKLNLECGFNFLHLFAVALIASCSCFFYCNATRCTPELIFSVSEDNLMWDPTANTTFQQVQDGDIAYFTDKLPAAAIKENGTIQHTVTKRGATKDRRFLWANAIIPYNISHSYSCEERDVILKALCTWEERTCIRFVQRTTQRDYITIYPGGGCSSFIGRVGGNQGVSIGRSCFSFHTALHEIGHAIGFFHEQSRPDRDDYVDINYDNIIPGAASQFRKLTDDDVDSLGIGYDYNSIMHYDYNLFAHSHELSTIVAKDSNIHVGGGRTLSELDIVQTNLLYQCPEVLPPRSTACPVEASTMPTPFPELPYPNCGGTIEITMDEWDKTYTIESPNYPAYTQNVDCGWLIRVPQGFQAMITVEPMSIKRSSRCREDYIMMYDSLTTDGFQTGRHCGSRKDYIIMSSTSSALVRYHTGSTSSTSGYHGFRAIVEAFDTDECRRSSTCSHTCTNLPGSFECSCPDGYYLSSNGQDCFDTNECGLGNGGCDHKCVNLGGGYHCECDEGYVLQSDGRNCRINATLNMFPGNLCEEHNDCEHLCKVFGGVARCACRDGYTLASDGKGCEDIDECAAGNGGCGQICTNTRGSFECSCQEGYSLATDGRQCEDINECATGNGGCEHTCVNSIGSFECSCRQGHELLADGKMCEVPFPNLPYPSCGETIEITMDEWDNTYIIESPNYPTYSQNVDCGWLIRVPKGFQVMVTVEPMSIKWSSRCRNDYIMMYDSFTTDGFHSGEHCGSRRNYIIMSISSYALVHYHTGLSSSTSGYHGFRAKVQAYDTDECHRPNMCSHICNNVPGSYECSCRDGYFLSTDRKNCIDINECESDNGGCDHKCVNREGGYQCECDEGYTLQTNGRTCSSASAQDVTPVDLCEAANCEHLCGVFGGMARCACRSGYTLASDGRQCEDINECTTGNGGCGQICTNTRGSFECSCQEGYHLATDGKRCEDINECATGNGGCEHTCMNTAGSYECSCREGYKLLNDGGICAAVTPPTIVTTENVADIGNDIRIEDIPIPQCGAVLTALSGTFKSPNWPQTYPTNVLCEWTIVLPDKEKRVEITFDYPFGIAGRLPGCAKDWVKIYDGLDEDTDESGPFCYFTRPETFESSSHVAKVVLFAGPKHSPSRVGFRASYRSV